jgi:DNA-binding CsgD family transcriptional regulator
VDRGAKTIRHQEPDPWWCLGQGRRVRATAIDEDLLLVSVAAPKRRLAGLSRAERAVSLLALQGLSNQAIAEIRGASPRTIANHLANVYRKLGVNGRRELRARISTKRDPSP